MRYRKFSDLGWNVSEIGLGTWEIGGCWGNVSSSDARNLLKEALDRGINFFDTSDVYGDGRSEKFLGELLKSTTKKFFVKLKKGSILLDEKTCSVYLEQLIKKKFKVIKKEDPIYILKSIKNNIEIKNMINAHIIDGVALTKFIYWIKNLKKLNITEVDAQNKLEKIRRMSPKYLFPSFNTIAGSGKNGAIVHYRATKNNTKLLKRNEIFLCDSGGQYKFGTTDVTRTICFKNQNKNFKKIFTNVLKGHIAVANINLNKINVGKKIDLKARKFLKQEGLDYGHGTGHGVGFFFKCT